MAIGEQSFSVPLHHLWVFSNFDVRSPVWIIQRSLQVITVGDHARDHTIAQRHNFKLLVLKQEQHLGNAEATGRTLCLFDSTSNLQKLVAHHAGRHTKTVVHNADRTVGVVNLYINTALGQLPLLQRTLDSVE